MLKRIVYGRIFDVTVIEASVSHSLARRGLKVLILERRSIGSGASSASGRLVHMHYDIEVDTALVSGMPEFLRTGVEASRNVIFITLVSHRFLYPGRTDNCAATWKCNKIGIVGRCGRTCKHINNMNRAFSK